MTEQRSSAAWLDRLAPAAAPWRHACDSHIHIYDQRYSYCEGADLQPPPASVADYQHLQAQWGTSRVVVVQPSSYGLDNRCTLDAVARMGAQARAVVVIDADTAQSELQAMHEQGARGVRFNLLRPSLVASEAIERLAARIAPLGWHLQLHAGADQIAALSTTLCQLPVPLVFDHMARLPQDGAHSAFAVVAQLLQQGRAWVKLSGLELFNTPDAPHYKALLPLARQLIALAPERMLWGTNWPHPANSSASAAPVPDTTDMLRWLVAACEDTALLHTILVTNPAQLYGFTA